MNKLQLLVPAMSTRGAGGTKMGGIKFADRAGRLGWMLAAALIAAAWISSEASAQTLNTLVTFAGTNGAIPEDRGGLIADTQGDLFGTTGFGGTYGRGTVFEIKVNSSTATGYASTPITLYNFTGGDDGVHPFAGLIADASGNLFGTTSEGGPIGAGAGTVFEIKVDSSTATGYATTPITLVSLNGTDGGDIYAGLVFDAHGNLFGEALAGGVNDIGTVFEVPVDSTSATGYATTPIALVSFNNADGQYPFGGLIVDTSGNLFGTADLGGGSAACDGGCGTVFEVKFNSTTGTYASTPTTLYSFTGGVDGANSEAGLITDAHGDLFGTTSTGGMNDDGTVFEIKVDNTTATGYASTPTTLVSFSGGADEENPFGGLIADADGNLFGVTSGGISNTGYGTVFEIKVDSTTATGYATTPTTLITFDAGNGAYPIETLIADVHGNLFGTAYAGGTLSTGAFGDGTVFEVTGSGFVPPLGFAGTPGTPNCHGVSISTLAQTYGGIDHAAMSLGYASVMALQNAVKAFCGN
jgi:uncharacterized repeat protein (TIGR03803 family)